MHSAWSGASDHTLRWWKPWRQCSVACTTWRTARWRAGGGTRGASIPPGAGWEGRLASCDLAGLAGLQLGSGREALLRVLPPWRAQRPRTTRTLAWISFNSLSAAKQGTCQAPLWPLAVSSLKRRPSHPCSKSSTFGSRPWARWHQSHGRPKGQPALPGGRPAGVRASPRLPLVYLYRLSLVGQQR